MIGFFVNRPVFTTVFYIIWCLMGIVNLVGIDVEDEPTVKVSKYVVTVAFSSSIEGVLNMANDPLESKLLSLPGVVSVISDITHSGSRIRITFAQSTNEQENLIALQGIISLCTSEIANEARVSIDSSGNPNESAICLYLVSDKKTPKECAKFFNNQLKHILESINGISTISISAPSSDSCHISLIANAMYNYSIAYNSIKQALHTIGTQGGSCPLRIGNAITNVNVEQEHKAIEQYPILSVTGSNVSLRDIALVKYETETKESVCRVDNREAVFVYLYKRPESNLIQVVDNVKEQLPNLEIICKANNIKLGIAFDGSLFVKRGMFGVAKSLIEAIVLVAIVVQLFLGSVRAALIAITTIPLSILPIFTILKPLGINVHVYSLFGIVLAVGLVVDDGVIVIENIHQHIEAGIAKTKAVIDGTKKIAASIIAMTMTLAVVYAPIVLMQDPNIRNFRDFAITIATSVIISGLVSLTITPMMYDKMVHHNKHTIDHKRSNKLIDKVKDIPQLVFRTIENVYIYLLCISIRFRYIFMIITYIVVVLLSMIMSNLLVVEEHIEVDKGSVMFTVTSKRDNEMNVEYIDEQMMKTVDNIYESHIKDDIETIFTYSSGQSTSFDYIRVLLKPHNKRKFTMDQIISTVVNSHEDHPSDCRIFSTASTGSQRCCDVNLQIFDHDTYETLRRKTNTLVDHPGLKQLYSAVFLTDIRQVPSVTIVIDPDKCADKRVSSAEIIDVLTSLNKKRYMKQPVNEHINKIHIGALVLDENSRLNEMLNLTLQVYNEEEHRHTVIPINHFVTIKNTNDITRAYKINGIHGIGARFKLRPGVSIGQFKKELDKFNNAMAGICYASIDIEESRKIEAMNNTYVMFALSVILIYLIISALLESFIKSLTIMLTVPASMIGGIGMLMLTGQKINAVAIIGAITLVALVTKQGIMLVVDIVGNENNNELIDETVIKGCKRRFRPIIMTTICMILGAVPLLNKAVEFNEYKVPIATVIIGGMTLGTILTLFIVPCMYIIIAELRGTHIEKKDYKSLMNQLSSPVKE